jgi:hypothetical protein
MTEGNIQSRTKWRVAIRTAFQLVAQGELHLVASIMRAILTVIGRLAAKLDQTQPKAPAPPAFAELLLMMLGSKRTVDAMVGDFEQLFRMDLAEIGVTRARRRYWLRVLRSIGPAAWAKAKKIGVIGIIIDYSRSKLGL